MIYKILEYLNKRKLKYYFLIPTSYSFGNICEQIKLAALESENYKKKLLILPPKILQKLLNYNIPNNYLLNNILIFDKDMNLVNEPTKNKKFFFFILFLLVNFEFFIRRSTALLLKYFFKIKLNEINFFPSIGIPEFASIRSKIEFKDIKEQKFEKLMINIEKNKDNYCSSQLKNLGLNENDKFICLHLRDGEYKNDFNRRPVRNVDISNYYKAIEYLLSKNYFIIRIGRTQKERIKIINKKIIDYPFSDIKSEFMDLYLIKNCHFFIGNLSGPLEAAYMFDKPCLALDVNMIFEAFPRHKYSRSVFRKVYLKKNHKELSIKEFINLELKIHHWKFLDNSIEYQCLNEDEVLNEVISYTKLIEEKNFELNSSQKNFNNYLLFNLIDKVNNLKKNYLSSDIIDDINYYNKKLFYIKNSKGSYSKNFLEKHSF